MSRFAVPAVRAIVAMLALSGCYLSHGTPDAPPATDAPPSCARPWPFTGAGTWSTSTERVVIAADPTFTTEIQAWRVARADGTGSAIRLVGVVTNGGPETACSRGVVVRLDGRRAEGRLFAQPHDLGEARTVACLAPAENGIFLAGTDFDDTDVSAPIVASRVEHDFGVFVRPDAEVDARAPGVIGALTPTPGTASVDLTLHGESPVALHDVEVAAFLIEGCTPGQSILPIDVVAVGDTPPATWSYVHGTTSVPSDIERGSTVAFVSYATE